VAPEFAAAPVIQKPYTREVVESAPAKLKWPLVAAWSFRGEANGLEPGISRDNCRIPGPCADAHVPE
jgi:hypothetical protein